MQGIASAIRAAIGHRASERASIEPLPASVRIDDKVCLVTGANSGLGKAVAIELARRGGRVLMACRSGHPEAGEEVRRASGGDARMLEVDLADLDAVHGLCDRLAESVPRIDIAVLNAGLMPARPRRSRQGFELMFAVHFLANRVLVDRLVGDGLLGRDGTGVSRIVFVTSETHRAAEPIDFDRLGAPVEYGLRDGLKHYGRSKLAMCTYACELSRRLNPDGGVDVAVHALCPGPVDSGIAREAPAVLKPLLRPIMKAFFLSPARAAEPVIHLCCSADAGRRTGMYLHMMREKRPSPLAHDPESGARLWERSAALVASSPSGSD